MGHGGVRSVVIPEGVTTIESQAFAATASLREVMIADSVEIIGENAFFGSGIKTIEIPSKVKWIDKETFANCSSLKRVVLSESVVSIGENAFSNCVKLEEIVIPNSAVNIHESAFYYCPKLNINCLPKGYAERRKPDDYYEVTNGVLRKLRCPSGEVVIPEGVTEIAHWVFNNHRGVKSVVLPESLERLDDDTFVDCINLKTVRFPGSVFDVNWSAFRGCNNLVVELPEEKLRDGVAVSPQVANFKVVTTDLGYTVLSLFQKGASWNKWRSERMITDPAKELAYMLQLLKEKKPFEEKTGKPVAEFIQKYYTVLDVENVKEILNLYPEKKCRDIERLLERRNIREYLGLDLVEDHPMDVLAREKLRKQPAEPETEKIVKKGICWSGSKERCSLELLQCVLSHYIREWKRWAVEELGEMGSVSMLRNGSRVRHDPEIDQLAHALDQKELSEFLTKRVNTPGYRSSLLAWARFANEEDIAEVSGRYKHMKRGTKRDKYFADNLKEALLSSDTKAAMLFFEEIGQLTYYASAHKRTAMELRDSVMMPEFGFDVDGVKRYDIGGNTIEVRITSALGFELFDVNKQKTIRAFPKKGDDPAKAEAVAREFAQFKKDVQTFVKQRTELLCKMHLSGETVSFAFWKDVYLQHPIIKWLVSRVIWMDNARNTFAVMDGQIVGVDRQPYEPQSPVSVAHVLSMRDSDISAWQETLTETGWLQLFEQIWEPKYIVDFTTLSNRYNGLKISDKERNRMKANLKRRGIVVRSGEMERAFNHRGGAHYVFSGFNIMYFGDSLEIEYTVDEVSKEVTFGEAKVTHGSPKKMNRILLELDRALVQSWIEKDEAECLSDAVLEAFSAAQISEFVDMAVKQNSIHCTARLLDCKNKRFSQYASMSEFILNL